ncbi:unnamed protein product [Thelazia callipaeda]|uniref:GRIP domain-containing protein n=1 Tax=Thelazia callipaeda TaxID=103827 RepID=A0A3P7LAR9_THECL|nr:unnamed protein product [Thelazia callipaeda]
MWFKILFIDKVELDRQRLLRDLQREINQLYRDLNERTRQLDEAQSKLQELSATPDENNGSACKNTDQETNEQWRDLRVDFELDEQKDYELCALRSQIAEYQKKLRDAEEAHKQELKSVCEKASATAQYNVNLDYLANGFLPKGKQDLNDSNSSLAEPTEAEYLRNVLYRYMHERETLGRESVTLARVIGTVARFTREQLNAVVAKEEQRNHGWVEGTVQGLISTAASLTSR